MEGVENYMGKRIFFILKSIFYHQINQFLIGKVLTFRLIVDGKEFDFSICLGKNDGISDDSGTTALAFSFRSDGHTDLAKMSS